MTTFIGTAAGYRDLITKLDQHLTSTGHAWGITFAGVGNGRMRGPGGTTGGYIGTATSVTETITVTFTSATAFNVVGSVSGSMGSGTVGTDFSGTRVAFRIVAGTTAFSAGDVFTLNTGPAWTRLRLQGMGNTVDGVSANFTNALNLVDGSTATSISTTVFPATMTWQFDFATTVKSVRIQNHNTAGQGPGTFVLEWSNDGTAWTPYQTYSGITGWAANEVRLFTVTTPIARLWWRVRITAGQTATLALQEMRLCGDAAGTYALDENTGGIQGVWRSPGVDGITQAHHSMRTWTSSGADTWNMLIAGHRFWNNQAADPSVVLNDGTSTFKSLPLTKSTAMAYWLVVNGARYILAVRVSGIYQVAYSGFILPYETPADYPWPMAVGAVTDSASQRWDSGTLANNRNPWDPGTTSSTPGAPGGLAVFQPNGAWREFANRNDSSGADGTTAAGSTQRGKTWPYTADENGAIQMDIARECIDGTQPLIPVVLTIPAFTGFVGAVLGEFDGIYWTSGFGNTAEAILRDGAIDVMALPNVYRTSRQHWGAIALD